MIYSLGADLLLFVHVAVVLFVGSGPVCVGIGARRGWQWIRNPVYRWGHLLCIGFIILQTWLGELCPLTVWEQTLREQAGQATYSGSFVAHWLEEILYIDAPLWAFTVAYTLFGGLVILSWIRVPPRSFIRTH